jgi:hypothetical protein
MLLIGVTKQDCGYGLRLKAELAASTVCCPAVRLLDFYNCDNDKLYCSCIVPAVPDRGAVLDYELDVSLGSH